MSLKLVFCGAALTFVPFRWLVKEKHDPLCVIDLKLLLYRLIFLFAESKLGLGQNKRQKRNWVLTSADLHIVYFPCTSTIGNSTFILRGPFDPSTFVSY